MSETELGNPGCSSRARSRVLVYTHAECLLHDVGSGHPEQPRRLSAVLDALASNYGEQLEWHQAPMANETQLLRAHTHRLIDELRAAVPASGPFRLDADTVVSPGSLHASLRSAGAVCAAIDRVIAGPQRRAFCAVRPPGHHSSADVASGFCLYNQIAVGARHALVAHGLARIAIVDFDVHHGNGTQSIFEADPTVLVVSSHQSPLYPGTGSDSESGIGNVVNGTLAPGTASKEFRELWRSRLLPAVDAFAPELLLVSAGFDAHRLDPLADLDLGGPDYYWITQQLCDLADRHAEGRMVSALEGGYSLTALREGSVAHVRALLGR